MKEKIIQEVSGILDILTYRTINRAEVLSSGSQPIRYRRALSMFMGIRGTWNEYGTIFKTLKNISAYSKLIRNPR